MVDFSSFLSTVGVGPTTRTGLSGGIGGLSDTKDVYPDKSSIQFSDFFYQNYGIDGKNWNKAFGYSLAHNIGDKNNSIALPLSPQNISIDVPSAINTTTTLRGIIEEHNGAPLRRIMIRGSSGVLNTRNGSVQLSNTSTGDLGIFKNTISSVNRVSAQFDKLKATYNGDKFTPLNYSSSELESKVKQSGYHFIHSLCAFLDQYLAGKKKVTNKDKFLQFQMIKDIMYWDCSLQNYSIQKLPGTLEYEYTLSLLAWRRATTPLVSNRLTPQISVYTPKNLNKLAQGLALIRGTRRLINASVGVLTGIRSDVDQSLLSPLREIILAGGEAIGAVNTLIDFPMAMVNNAKFSIEQSIVGAKSAALSRDDIKKMGQDLNEGGVYPTSSVSANVNYNAVDALDSLAQEKEGQTSTKDGSSPIDSLFADPLQNQNFFDNFKVDDLALPPEMQRQVQLEKDRVAAFSADDLKSKRNTIASYAASIATGLGGGDSTYNRIYGVAGKKTYKILSTADIELLANLNTLVIQIDSMLSFMKNNGQGTSDYFTYYSDIAKANSITFENSQSKFYVPFPYGSTLNSLASQYLGDSNRWIEIAAINGLKQPYVDEVGFELPFKSSGSSLSALFYSADNLYVGQTVQILSDTQKISTRKITKIDVLSATDVAITFDGTEPLNAYTILDNAKLKAFLPDTVNSLKLIAIPSLSVVSDPTKIKTNVSKSDLDFLTSLAKVDFLLTQEGDLALTSAGDIQPAVGLANIVQAANMKLLTNTNTIITDPTFGNPVSSGRAISDTNAAQILKAIQDTFADDPRFGQILGTKITIMGPTAAIDLAVSVADTDYTLPLTVQLPV